MIAENLASTSKNEDETTHSGSILASYWLVDVCSFVMPCWSVQISIDRAAAPGDAV